MKKENIKAKKTQKKKRSFNRMFIFIICIIIVLLLALILMFNRKWVQVGNVISKGNISYEIGDYYDYDESLNGEYNILDVKWKVMGVDEDGHLLIMSTSSVGDLNLGDNEDFNENLDDYLSGLDQMNAIAKIYGKGKNAVYSRSINIDDILKVFNLKSSEYILNSNKISYSWGKENEIYYKNLVNNESGLSKISHDGIFVFFNENKNEWVLSYEDSYLDVDDKTIGTLNSNIITFNRFQYNEDINDYQNLFDEDSKEYAMICKDEKSYLNSYWVANRFVNALENYANYGFSSFKTDSLNYDYVVNSLGKIKETTHGVRVVVAIK